MNKSNVEFSDEILGALEELKVLAAVITKALEENPLLKNVAIGRANLVGSVATCIAANNITLLSAALPRKRHTKIIIRLVEMIAPTIMWVYMMGLLDAANPSGDKIAEEKLRRVVQVGSSE